VRFSSSDQTRFFKPFFPAITNLKMSTINGGHYHPLHHAGRAVRPDGYSIALVVPLHKSTPSHQRHPRFGIDGELAPERLHLASARPIAGTARRIGSQSLCRPLRASRSSSLGVISPS